jgi:putative oxidoreductase
MTRKTVLLWTMRLGLAGLLLFSGYRKALDTGTFAIEIANYQLFPSLAPYLAVTLPTIELTIGLALLLGPRAWMRAGALAACGVMAVFLVAVTSVVVRGIDIRCGCFGGDSGSVNGLTILRNVLLMSAAAWLYRLASQPQSQSGNESVS